MALLFKKRLSSSDETFFAKGRPSYLTSANKPVSSKGISDVMQEEGESDDDDEMGFGLFDDYHPVLKDTTPCNKEMLSSSETKPLPQGRYSYTSAEQPISMVKITIKEPLLCDSTKAISAKEKREMKKVAKEASKKERQHLAKKDSKSGHMDSRMEKEIQMSNQTSHNLSDVALAPPEIVLDKAKVQELEASVAEASCIALPDDEILDIAKPSKQDPDPLMATLPSSSSPMQQQQGGLFSAKGNKEFQYGAIVNSSNTQSYAGGLFSKRGGFTATPQQAQQQQAGPVVFGAAPQSDEITERGVPLMATLPSSSSPMQQQQDGLFSAKGKKEFQFAAIASNTQSYSGGLFSKRGGFTATPQQAQQQQAGPVVFGAAPQSDEITERGVPLMATLPSSSSPMQQQQDGLFSAKGKKEFQFAAIASNTQSYSGGLFSKRGGFTATPQQAQQQQAGPVVFGAAPQQQQAGSVVFGASQQQVQQQLTGPFGFSGDGCRSSLDRLQQTGFGVSSGQIGFTLAGLRAQQQLASPTGFSAESPQVQQQPAGPFGFSLVPQVQQITSASSSAPWGQQTGFGFSSSAVQQQQHTSPQTQMAFGSSSAPWGQQTGFGSSSSSIQQQEISSPQGQQIGFGSLSTQQTTPLQQQGLFGSQSIAPQQKATPLQHRGLFGSQSITPQQTIQQQVVFSQQDKKVADQQTNLHSESSSPGSGTFRFETAEARYPIRESKLSFLQTGRRITQSKPVEGIRLCRSSPKVFIDKSESPVPPLDLTTGKDYIAGSTPPPIPQQGNNDASDFAPPVSGEWKDVSRGKMYTSHSAPPPPILPQKKDVSDFAPPPPQMKKLFCMSAPMHLADPPMQDFEREAEKLPAVCKAKKKKKKAVFSVEEAETTGGDSGAILQTSKVFDVHDHAKLLTRKKCSLKMKDTFKRHSRWDQEELNEPLIDFGEQDEGLDLFYTDPYQSQVSVDSEGYFSDFSVTTHNISIGKPKLGKDEIHRLFDNWDKEGFWNFTDDSVCLGLLKFSWLECAKVLSEAGIKSLGEKVHKEIEKLVCTILVFARIMQAYFPEMLIYNIIELSRNQTLWNNVVEAIIEKEEECASAHLRAQLLHQYEDHLETTALWCIAVMDQHPMVYSTLELGKSWEDVARRWLDMPEPTAQIPAS